MLSDPRQVLASLAVLGLIAASAVAPAASARPNGADACTKWGDTLPTQLRAGQARKSVICFLNAARKNDGLRPLKRSRILQAAAQQHNVLMVQSGCFAHVCPSELDLDIRLEDAGYLVDGLLSFAYGENIGWGTGRQGTPRGVTGSWLSSPAHRANVLDPDFREVGVGFSIGSPDPSGLVGGVYTADFGARAR